MKRRGASGLPEEQQALVESRDDNSDSDSDDEAQPDFVEQRSWLGNLAVAVRYVWAENLKQKRNFFVGATAVFLVVFSIGYVRTCIFLWPSQIHFSVLLFAIKFVTTLYSP
jgi:hypothetical protein